MTQEQYNQFWNHYFVIEKGFYESLLADNEVVTGTIPQLAEKYGIAKMVIYPSSVGCTSYSRAPQGALQRTEVFYYHRKG